MLDETSSSRSIVLVAEIFPPAIGGSGELLKNVYERLAVPHVTVLTNRSPGPGDRAVISERLTVTAQAMTWRSWGLAHPSSLRAYLNAALGSIRLRDPSTVIHAARILPEGLAALIGSMGAPFICWAHGEELQYIGSSGELKFLFNAVQRRAARILANSRNTAQLLQRMGVSAHKIRVAYPGVDTSRFMRTARAQEIRHEMLRDEKLLFLTVGRLQRRKGHDVTLKALRTLVGTIPSFRYVIVGAGPEAESLRTLVRELDLRSHVIFQPSVSHDDLPAYYRAADIFIHPNRVDGLDFEGFGIVFLEAAASGLVAVGGRSGGVPEAIADNVTGVLVDGDDVSEVADAIKRLSVDPDLRQHLGDQGHERVRQYFTWDRAADIVLRTHLECAK